MEKTIKLGVSSCLLGHRVRYDGGHKLDHFLVEILGRYVEWVPVCPEVDCGLPIPREVLRLIGTPAAPRLVTGRTGIDHTDRMLAWAKKRLHDLAGDGLCGFIFKSNSASSGMRNVKVYGPSGASIRRGIGIFAGAFMEAYPVIPVEDENRLNDPSLRENFIERIFVLKRWKELVGRGGNIGDTIDFHSDHQLLVLSHSPRHYTELGRLVANAKRIRMERLQRTYLEIMMDGLKLLATVKKNTRVLHHVMGYFDGHLHPDQKKELMETINGYHKGSFPLIVPITLLKYYVRACNQSHLARQYYLNRDLVEPQLGNHA